MFDIFVYLFHEHEIEVKIKILEILNKRKNTEILFPFSGMCYRANVS